MLGVRTALVGALVAVLVAIVGPATASASYTVPYGNTALGDAIWNETWATGIADRRQQRM